MADKILIVDMIYGAILLVVTLLGTPANAFSFYYFLSKKRDISSAIYICITAVDTFTCLCALPPALSYFNNRKPTMFEDDIFCNIWIVVFRVLSAMSIFCVALLSITRTYLLLTPFKSIPLRLVYGVISLYFFFLCVTATIIFWEKGGHYMYQEVFVDCSFVDEHIKKYEKLSDVISKMVYTIPIFPILISCVISLVVLLKDSGNRNDNYQVGFDEKRYASITIVIFTFIFAVFNIPASLLNLIAFNPQLIGQLLDFDKRMYFGNFVFTLSIPLNALCNAVFYMIRMKQLREVLFTKLSLGYYASVQRASTVYSLRVRINESSKI